MLRQYVAEICGRRVHALLVHADSGLRPEQSARCVHPASIAVRVRVSSRRRPTAALIVAA
jgi:hypothetical protein